MRLLDGRRHTLVKTGEKALTAGVQEIVSADGSIRQCGLPASSIVVQPLAAHGTDVAEGAPPFAATPLAVSDERPAGDGECDE
jgi:hypothetical protein